MPEYVSTEDLNTYVEYMKMKRDEQLIEMERAKKELAQLRRYVKNFITTQLINMQNITLNNTTQRV